MARVFGVSSSTFNVMYSVDQTVGNGCPNVRDDVFLVQFFLRRLMDDDVKQNGGFIPPGEEPIKVDGAFGRQTAAYIKFFQEETIRRTVGPNDKRVDPMNGNLRSPTGGFLFTMTSFNFENFNRQGN
jgi:hypothetical protein